MPLDESRVVEIGGPDRVSYGDLMHEYAAQRGLKRVMISVPLLTPRLSSLWLRLVTPVYATVGRKLVDGLRNETIVREPEGMRAFALRPMGVKAAIGRAMRNEDREYAETRWTDAYSVTEPGRARVTHELRHADRRFAHGARGAVGGGGLRADPADRREDRILLWGSLVAGARAGSTCCSAGPDCGAAGGIRWRSRIGATLDCWRVEAFEPGRLLRLGGRDEAARARMAAVRGATRTGTARRFAQTAIFDPRGLAGLAYWYGLYPIHQFVFNGMLAGIARAAELGG